jgi:hypothetical protein
MLFAGACRHKQAQPEYIYVDSATRQHFAFKPGSYWIYKDSVSGRVDSCYVTKLDSSVGRNSDNTKIYQSIFSDMIQRPIVDPSSDSITVGIGLGQGIVAIRYVINNSSRDGILAFQLPYPFKLGKTVTAPDSCIAVSIRPDTILAGESYDNVISCFLGAYKNPQSYSWFHINDSVGIIQLSIYSDNVIARKWELQRFRILK